MRRSADGDTSNQEDRHFDDKSLGSNDNETLIDSGADDKASKKWLWLTHPEHAFIKGYAVKEDGQKLHVRCSDNSERTVNRDDTDKVNPPKYDRTEDMAHLTHLNEASVVHNLSMRYQANLIYTYSGLFLVAVNPYCSLPIYDKDHIEFYRNSSREDTKPHIFATADTAYRNMREAKENQSILVTGESGAGKTENTKRVIQYLTTISVDESKASEHLDLEGQILLANPILEAFGNAQTVRNNNSSRFGKFVRLEFARDGQIAGAYIDWYLLEKSRVVHQNLQERNYHIFYQLLKGASTELKSKLLLDGKWSEYGFLKNSNKSIPGVDDADEFHLLQDSFKTMGFSTEDQMDLYTIIAGVLHLGNLKISPESADQARIADMSLVEKLCHVLGIAQDQFTKALLRPRVKAGREWISQSRNVDQVNRSLEALAKSFYERAFGHLVSKINESLERSMDSSSFIGVLDIAGFEIFETNRFEQLCINYTNEKLQQFFNHHMFVLEQEEYARENIEWSFIDFGRDLQPTIDLIEKSKPIGIFACLDEDSVMPKASDKSFTEKLNGLWENKSKNYKRSLLKQGFIIRHYAADVEYSTDQWLERNKDPLNENITLLLANSSYSHIAALFSDSRESLPTTNPKQRIKRGLFRTVAQKHKDQLGSLMTQLSLTHPHFVRCIIPNHEKRSKRFHAPLVLDQLRCNGVLEGIRIARTGFPNRIQFAEFRHRYELITPNLPQGFLDGQTVAKVMLEKLSLDHSLYRVGLTKLFFRAGVLADLEEQRESVLRGTITKFQALSRGYMKRRHIQKRLFRSDATKIIQKNLAVYLELSQSSWWKLHHKMKPLLGATRSEGDLKKRDEAITKLENQIKDEEAEKSRLDAERRKADQDLQCLRETLESERALVIDKEEIFNRANEREIELKEQLAGSLDDLDRLEEQCDELMRSKKRGDEQAQKLLLQLKQGAEFISKLESEKKDILTRMCGLQITLSDAEREHVSRSDETDQLSLTHKEKKLAELENKLRTSDKDIETRLRENVRGYETSSRQVRDLVAENQQIRAQLSDLSSTSSDYESMIRKKESDLAVLRADLLRQAQDKKFLDSQVSALEMKHNAVVEEINQLKEDMEELQREKERAGEEAVEARRLLHAKISEDTKAHQSLMLLEKQVRQGQNLLSLTETKYQIQRQKNSDCMEKSNAEIESLKEAYRELLDEKHRIDSERNSRESELDQVRKEKECMLEKCGTVDAELMKLHEYVNKMESLRSASESAHQKMKGAFDEKTRSCSELEERLRTSNDAELSLEKQINAFKRQIGENDLNRAALSRSEIRLKTQVEDLSTQLAAEKLKRTNLEKDSHAKDSQQLQSCNEKSKELQDKLDKEQERNHQMSAELCSSRQSYDELLILKTTVDRQKDRFIVELEDLNHELSREQQSTRVAEKLSSSLRLQVAEVNRLLEGERLQKIQSQTLCRELQGAMGDADVELVERSHQLASLQKVVDSSIDDGLNLTDNSEILKPNEVVSKQLHVALLAKKVAEEGRARIEKQFEDARQRWHQELMENDFLNNASRRAILDELESDNDLQPISPPRTRKASFSLSPSPARKNSNAFPYTRTSAGTGSVLTTTNGNARDISTRRKFQDLETEVEMLQSKLATSEAMKNQLQSKLARTSSLGQNAGEDNQNMILRRENTRLHQLVDDNYDTISAMEGAQKDGILSLKDLESRSSEEIQNIFRSLTESRKSMFEVNKATCEDLEESKFEFDKARSSNIAIQKDLNLANSQIAAQTASIEAQDQNLTQLLTDIADMQIRLDAEAGRSADLEASLGLYKTRSEDYFGRLEHAEIAVLKSHKAEKWAKSQRLESEAAAERYAEEREEAEMKLREMSRKAAEFEEKLEDSSAELVEANKSKEHFQQELDSYRFNHTQDLEDREFSIDTTRKKYQHEVQILATELQSERGVLNEIREENRSLRADLSTLQSKWDEETTKSSSWAKEKVRIESKIREIERSRENAIGSQNESQSKIIALLSQIRSLRTTMDEIVAARTQLQNDKEKLEKRLTDMTERSEEYNKDGGQKEPGSSQELLSLKASLAQQEDIAASALEKLHRTEASASETLKEIEQERQFNAKLYEEKMALDKLTKELQLKVLDLETKGFFGTSKDVRFLQTRISELQQHIESEAKIRSENQKNERTTDRTIRELQQQVSVYEDGKARLENEIKLSEGKVNRLKSGIEELQASESNHQLTTRKAEREARMLKEKSLRLERELEGWKARFDKSMLTRSNTLANISEYGGGGSPKKA